MTDISKLLTAEKLQACITENPKIEAWHPVFLDYLPKYGIDTELRLAGFLSQTAYESSYWRTFTENLNYTAARLLVVFPKYFKSKAQAAEYDRKPEKIANYVYGNRLGNGDPSSGDGWKFRGRGAIQCTGKYNYGELSKWMFGFPEALWNNPDLVAKTDGVIMSAIWYWTEHGLNELADKKDVAGMTKRINGGTHGLTTRQTLFDRCLKVL
jgi:putative chitinase